MNATVSLAGTRRVETCADGRLVYGEFCRNIDADLANEPKALDGASPSGSLCNRVATI